MPVTIRLLPICTITRHNKNLSYFFIIIIIITTIIIIMTIIIIIIIIECTQNRIMNNWSFRNEWQFKLDKKRATEDSICILKNKKWCKNKSLVS